jgi:hypothetical protein
MFDFVFFILFMLFFFLIVVDNVKMKIKQKDLLVKLAQSDADNELLLNKISIMKDKEEIEKTDDFVSFLNQSRDWAFEYIKNVQLGISKFVSDIEPEINYFKEYGDIMSMAPNYYSMKKIAESYEELKKLLPQEED